MTPLCLCICVLYKVSNIFTGKTRRHITLMVISWKVSYKAKLSLLQANPNFSLGINFKQCLYGYWNTCTSTSYLTVTFPSFLFLLKLQLHIPLEFLATFHFCVCDPQTLDKPTSSATVNLSIFANWLFPYLQSCIIGS